MYRNQQTSGIVLCDVYLVQEMERLSTGMGTREVRQRQQNPCTYQQTLVSRSRGYQQVGVARNTTASRHTSMHCKIN